LGVAIGHTHAELKLTTLIGKQSVAGQVATQLGFDIEEVSTHMVSLADGRLAFQIGFMSPNHLY
jgi:hypothetical protein